MILATRLTLAVTLCSLPVMGDDVGPAGENGATAGPKTFRDKSMLGSPDFRPSPQQPVGWRGRVAGSRLDKRQIGIAGPGGMW